MSPFFKALINFATRFPDLFTLSFTPPTTITSIEHNENEEERQQEQKLPQDDVTFVATTTKSAGGNLTKAQKKKKKRAALAAVSSKALGDGVLTMDESIADPANWPVLCVIANCQLRLFISRCDPFLEVSIDSDRLWSTVGFQENCESAEVVEVFHHQEQGDDEAADAGDEKYAQKKLKRFSLLHHPKNSDLLPPAALATRLLLECLRNSPDVQQSAANALQRCLNGKPQEDYNCVLDYWLDIYHCLIEVCVVFFLIFFPYKIKLYVVVYTS